MKCISVFLLWAATAAAADFTTGQAARLVIGQTTFTNEDPNSSDTVLGAASGIAYAADTLFVADSNRVQATPSNHRVLLFQNLSSQLPSPTDELQYNRNCPVCLGKATVVLGQPDFTTTTLNLTASSSDLRLPTSVASDGVHLVVADTDHNRVMIWNHIPTTNNAPADVVVGQPNFTGNVVPPNNIPTANSLLGPQGVWIQNGKLYVADTQNNRVLIYNQIPTTNGAAADVVLGQPNFTTYVQIDIAQQTTIASATNLLNPVAVTSDGQRLYVADLGYNRVLVWNSIPTTNDTPANLALGQPDLNSSIPNNAFTVNTTNSACTTNPVGAACVETPVLCTVSNGVDVNSNPTYPTACNATLNFPRFALAAGNRLFIADGGNDRVLVFNQIPTKSGALADTVIGQIGVAGQTGGIVVQASNAADSLRTPMSLAWDGTNLYVSDAFNRRITVYSIAANSIPYSGVRNGASFSVFSRGAVNFAGGIQAGDTVTIAIQETVAGTLLTNNYTHTVAATDTLYTVVDALVKAINSGNNGAGDPYAIATADHVSTAVRLFARASGPDGDNVNYGVSVSASALIAATVAGAFLSGGADASQIAPGSLVSIFAKPGTVLAYGTALADLSQDQLPTELAATQVYFNGIRAPLLYVSPTQINAQIPWELADTTSISAFVRTIDNNGSVVATAPVAVSIVAANPGIFTYLNGAQQPVAVMLHGSSHATGAISIDGGVTAGDFGTVTINGRSYNYTVQSTDTLASVRDALTALINASDPEVKAIPTAEFTRIILQARVQGPDGEGIPISVSTLPAPVVAGGALVLTALSSTLCCSSVQYSLVTPDNPAVTGEIVLIYATGIGLPVATAATATAFQTGRKFPANTPVTSPGSDVGAAAAGITANVLQVAGKPGTFGVYELMLQIASNLNTDPYTQLTITQNSFLSNLTTFPVVNPIQALSP
jgi:uncharacterized protein (TIGR03437 family)